MKKIICAVDFSTGSLHALDYAFIIANRFGADIEMVWVDFAADAMGLTAISRDLRLEVKKQFEDLLAVRKSKLNPGKLSYKLKKGKVYQEIASHSRCENADLIIAGSHGVSGFEQYWIGSNAYRIVSYAPCPVITMRSAFAFDHEIQRIVLPIDTTAETKSKVPFAAMFAQQFDAEIHILALHHTKLVSLQKKVNSAAQDVARKLGKQGLRHLIITQQSENITSAAIDYALQIEADLIAITTEKETSTAHIMLGPYAQQIVNHSPIPVLSINTKSSN